MPRRGAEQRPHPLKLFVSQRKLFVSQRTGRRGGPPPCGEDDAEADRQRQDRGRPKQDGLAVKGRTEPYEVSVARDHPVPDLTVTRAGRHLLADRAPEVPGEVGVGRLNALVLADEAAQLAANCLCSQLQRPVAQHLTGVADGERAPGPDQAQQSQRVGRAPHPKLLSRGRTELRAMSVVTAPTHRWRTTPPASRAYVSGTP